VDLSGIIFVALAIGWAVYLIPKALQREDEKALSRSVESFSDSVRVLGRRAAATAPTQTEPVPATATAPVVHRVTRQAARDAARRRRRVLGVLLTLLLGTVLAAAFAVAPWWSTAIPGGLVVGFLVVARLAVRAQQVRRFVADLDEASGPIEGLPLRPSLDGWETQPDRGREDTVSVSAGELAAAVAAPTTDAGGLWDPLPITLPTYVTKPRARRTVRTIELTHGDVTSSGHDAADSALARRAAAEEAADKQATSATESGEDRKVVGG
jgi:hypothetical protein